uniref:Uncharacterized protein n=1 Tax=Sciurus vulgaris TaxID=55149 RepID=A0A8D2AV77_SCIVU
MFCQNNHDISWTYPEVLRIHMQPFTMQLTQLGKDTLEIIYNPLAMGLDLGITHNGRGRGQVSKVVEEPLGPWIDNQEPILPSQGFSSSLFHIHFSPHACDSSFILSCEMNHGVWFRSLSIISDASEASMSNY